MSTKHYPSVEYVRQCLRYESGRLYWIGRPQEHFSAERDQRAWNTTWAGKEAGCPSVGKAPRWQINIGGHIIRRYTLVWFIHKGEWPELIDHENRDQLDDRIENLRIANPMQSIANTGRRKNNRSGYKGVSWNASGSSWAARIGVGRRHIHLGNFQDPAEAHAAYVEAAKKHFGEFYCAG